MENLNIFGFYWQIWLLGGRGGGVMKNQYRGGGGFGQFANLKGTWQEKGGVLRGDWNPNAHTDITQYEV